MKYYPREQFGFAVLYFTGSDHFNRSMRLYAGKKGFTLSDHGLFPVLRALKNQKVWKGDLIPCLTEEEVF
jgi:DNA polymerase lambda